MLHPEKPHWHLLRPYIVGILSTDTILIGYNQTFSTVWTHARAARTSMQHGLQHSEKDAAVAPAARKPEQDLV